MYNWRPVFKCELCDKTAIGIKDPWGRWIVPSNEGWSGSFKNKVVVCVTHAQKHLIN